MQELIAMFMNNLRILKGKNPGDCYYDEYLKHYKREGDMFYDQYSVAIREAVFNKPANILEIGVRTGLSICNMISAYVDFSKIERIVLIDTWADGFAGPGLVKMNLRAMNIPDDVIEKIEFIKGDSLVEVPKLEGKFEYILVDGDHNKAVARQDLENVVPLVASEGLIVFDDISKHGCDLLDVWEDFKAYHKDGFEFTENLFGKGTGEARRYVY